MSESLTRNLEYDDRPTLDRSETRGLVNSRVAQIAVVAAVLLATIPAVFCASDSITASSSWPVIAQNAKVVAVTDSTGRIHVAWVEKSTLLDGARTEALWHTMYDPEDPHRSPANRLDSSSMIDSVDMTVDDFDNVHIVWVKEVPNTTLALPDPQNRGSTRGIYYLSVDANQALSGTPQLILESPADTVSTSITIGYESQLFLVWTESVRENSTDVESIAYYAKLARHDQSANLTRTLVTRTGGTSQMLEATIAPDRTTLHLVWLDELSASSSRVMYSRVDLLHNVTATFTLQDVNRTVGRLMLSPTPSGEVVIGWAYQDPSPNEPLARVTRLSREGNTTLSNVEIHSRYFAGLEAMTLDSNGNLQVVFLELDENVPAGPRRVRIAQPTFRYIKFNTSGEPSEERLEVSILPSIGAFVVDSGELYVVSLGGMLVAATPMSSGNPGMFLLAVLLVASIVSGMGTEAGTYQVARWGKSVRWSNGVVCEEERRRLEARLLRRMGKQPGITLSELKCFGLHTSRRLIELEESGAICCWRDGTRQRFYCTSSALQNRTSADRTRESILRIIAAQPGLTEAHVARHLGLSQQLANYHLRILSEARILRFVRADGRVSYFVSEWYRKHATR